MRGKGVVDERRDFDILGLRAGRQQLYDRFDKLFELERLFFEVELAGLDLGEVENFLDQRKQHIAGSAHRLHIAFLLRTQRGVAQEVGHAQDAIEGRADFMRHHGEEPALGVVCRFGLFACFGERSAPRGRVR